MTPKGVTTRVLAPCWAAWLVLLWDESTDKGVVCRIRDTALDLLTVAEAFVLERARLLDAVARLRENASGAIVSLRVTARRLTGAFMLGSIGFWKLILTEVSSPFGRPPEITNATETALELGAQDALLSCTACARK